MDKGKLLNALREERAHLNAMLARLDGSQIETPGVQENWSVKDTLAHISVKDVIIIYQRLLESGIQVWLAGGWGVDALLGEQTRPHKDLDVIMLLDDVVQLREILGRDGYGLKDLWSENRWVVDAHGVEIPTAFVLQDSEGRELDAHAMRLDDQGNGVPAWEGEGLVFRKEDLAGAGTVAGVAVQCLSPEMQVLFHTGYELPDEQLRDLGLLHKKFGVEYPDEHSRPRSLGV